MQLHQNEETVNSIISVKVASGHTRPHPDLPDDESARLYYVGDLLLSSANLYRQE